MVFEPLANAQLVLRRPEQFRLFFGMFKALEVRHQSGINAMRPFRTPYIVEHKENLALSVGSRRQRSDTSQACSLG